MAASYVLAVLITVSAMGFGVGGARAQPDARATETLNSFGTTAGPYTVAKTIDVHACTSLYGMVANGLMHGLQNSYSDLRCSTAFPNGLDNPAGVALYYPKGSPPRGEKFPVLLWTGGILSDPGMYDSFAERVASKGYVVAISYDYVNSFGWLPLLAASTVARADHDRHSALRGRVDLSRVVVGGHSAGGAATQQAVSLPSSVWRGIDPAIRIRGAVPVEPGPVALGSLLRVPTLYLSGYNDIIVPHYLWVMWTQYSTAAQVPAYLACFEGTNHLTPVDDPDHNYLLRPVMAWLDYTLKHDARAAQLFTGQSWQLPRAAGVKYAIRNARATAVR
ncbi:hypothetical protein QNM97_09245 [Gordonia sp. L191]|uniref:poly(ethylene terephthalate) hydrolase family protein n=1 Tax=Gordonia sp. L191 TaxID=2982699 RepID=UPI0024C030FC|nr:hypothetical protein [Gordonia sp. L191]WHU49134.1 hypothetical protein QNM97_09245 [Gordonia sp. L191]